MPSVHRRTTRMKKITLLRAILLGGLSTGAWMGGCAIDPIESAQPDTGQVAFDLQVAPGIVLDTVEYTITGPLGFSRKGAIDVGHSSTVSAIIAGLPFGLGYSISLRSMSPD